MVKYATPEEEWRAQMEGTDPNVVRMRRFMDVLPAGPRCKFCHAPFGAPSRFILRPLGFTPWEKNPNLCKKCIADMDSSSISGAEVHLSMAFIDVRGSSQIARDIGDTAFSQLMARFYDIASTTLFAHDALLDKFIGDQVTALFLPFAAGEQHAAQAVAAARAVLEATGHGSSEGPWLPLGAGVHTGTAFVGVVARTGQQKEFTALGDAVNIAGHLAAEARAGEILITDEAAVEIRRAEGAAASDPHDLEHRDLSLKGQHVGVRVLDTNITASDV